MQKPTNNKAGQFQFWAHNKPGVGNYSQPMQPPGKEYYFCIQTLLPMHSDRFQCAKEHREQEGMAETRDR